MSDEVQRELAAIATELGRHLRWAQALGETTLPQADAAAVAMAAARASPAPAAAARTADLPSAEPNSNRATPQFPAPGQTTAASLPRAAAAQRPTLESVREELGACTRCKLCSGRTNIVFGDGNPAAELVFVGEGPGGEEDARGLPFVGAAGQLLDRMIAAMGYRRDEVYICNVVKCRPPGNRNPEPDEVDACEPFLRAQLEAIRPKAIVALGKFAAQTLLRDPTPITKLRGQWREYQGIRLMPTFHPAYLLRNEAEKAKAWKDLQAVMALLGKSK